MSTKRLTIELSMDQYEFIRKEAKATETTVSGFIRKLISEWKLHPPDEITKNYKDDPLYRRRGSFDGPTDLAEHHDQYLYGSRKK